MCKSLAVGGGGGILLIQRTFLQTNKYRRIYSHWNLIAIHVLGNFMIDRTSYERDFTDMWSTSRREFLLKKKRSTFGLISKDYFTLTTTNAVQTNSLLTSLWLKCRLNTFYAQYETLCTAMSATKIITRIFH